MQRTHHAQAVSQDSGKEVLQLAILGSEPTCLHTVFCISRVRYSPNTYRRHENANVFVLLGREKVLESVVFCAT